MMTPRLTLIASAILGPMSAAGQQAPPRADLIVTGARIYTVDATRPRVEALVIRGTRLAFVGSASEAAALAGPSTRVIDLHGATVIPGMTDSHAHLLDMGLGLERADLRGASSLDDVIARVAARARTAPAGSWVYGWGWDQNLWPGGRFPTHEALDRALGDHPVVLDRIDGHAVLANALAMQAAHVDRNTPDPSGGKILRDAAGNPTGVFVDNAVGLVVRAEPPMSDGETRSALLAAVRECNRWGITGLHDAGVSRRVLDLYDTLARSGSLTLRDYAMVADDSAALVYYFGKGPQSALYDGHLWIRSVKLYADGALGSRGAALLAPYSDDPGNTGLLVSTPEHLRDVATRALRAGFQIATHAIGDRGNRMALDAYGAALKAVPTADHRFRIEHASVIDPADILRFAELGVIPSMQGVFAPSDMNWAADRLGPSRVLNAYAWRSLLNTGVIIPDGSDMPVERVSPLYSFHGAVTRQDDRGWPPGGWYPAQRMTREEALEGMTLWAAYAGFQEHDLGSLTAGKYADFVVLDRDIMTVGEGDIIGTKVLATYIGGRAVYEAPAH